MKKTAIFLGLGTLACAAFVVATPKATALAGVVSAINGAEGISVEYSVTEVGGITQNFSVALSKPNLARIETTDEVLFADGRHIYRYNKKENSYYKVPQSESELRNAFGDQALSTWLPFFDKNAFNGLAQVKDAGTRNRRGATMKIVEAQGDARGDSKMTYYIDSSDNIARQAEFSVKTLQGTSTYIMNVKSVEVGALHANTFVFTAPEKAKEVDMSAATGKWMYDYDKALMAAAPANSLIMVDFMATWCGPCKMMEAQVFNTPEFKSATKDMVLLKIDVDVQTSIAQKYGIEAMPTVKFIDKSGNVVHEFVGYGGFNQVMNEVQTAKAKHKK